MRREAQAAASRGCQLIVAAAVLALMGQVASAQLRFEGQEDDNLPIHITSDYMEADNKANVIVFSGNVVSVRGDMNVTSDRMRVFNSQQGRRVEKIIWTGNVHFEMDGQHATGETAIFSDSAQTLTLTGNPEAWEGDNRIVGEEMIIYLREDKSVVKGSTDERIHVTLSSESMEEQAPEGEVEAPLDREAEPAEEPAASSEAQ